MGTHPATGRHPGTFGTYQANRMALFLLPTSFSLQWTLIMGYRFVGGIGSAVYPGNLALS
jgi:hypothetical protein